MASYRSTQQRRRVLADACTTLSHLLRAPFDAADQLQRLYLSDVYRALGELTASPSALAVERGSAAGGTGSELQFSPFESPASITAAATQSASGSAQDEGASPQYVQRLLTQFVTTMPLQANMLGFLGAMSGVSRLCVCVCVCGAAATRCTCSSCLTMTLLPLPCVCRQELHNGCAASAAPTCQSV